MSRQAIFEASLQYFLGPIVPLLDDDSVTEIMINRFDDIYVERKGRLEKTSVRFEDDDALLSAVHNVAQWIGREIDRQRPTLDARLPDGSRVHAIVPPSARGGTYVTIRKFSREAMTLEDLIRLGSLSESAREFLELCVVLRKNMLISGGTGTGKTALLNAMSRAIPGDQRIVVIEDTSELQLVQPHTLYLEAQRPDQLGRGAVNIRDLFVNSLRMRPDRIIVGEVRSGEALDLIQSMLSGHTGSLSTIHANTPHDALMRLETLSLMSNVDIPVYVARAQVASAIDLVVQIARFTEDGSRKVTRISEVLGLGEREQYELRDLFESRFQGRADDGRLMVELEPTGRRPTFCAAPYNEGCAHRIAQSAPLWLAPGEADEEVS
jgi:pilus assembly protein CpaF